MRIPYAGYDPSSTKHPGAVDLTDDAVLRDQRLKALERECARQRATIKSLEQTMVVVSKLVSGYAAKANGR